MSKFDYMNFSDGSRDIEFVAHAKKFTKEEAIRLCLQENDYKFMEKYCGGNLYREPTVEDVLERSVRWYPAVPEFCDFDVDGGCYTYCKKGGKGSFPVWVIEFETLCIDEESEAKNETMSAIRTKGKSEEATTLGGQDQG